ncbi:MAG: AAA family ATPase [Planctomycetes bacterium]|nr:AAA family ATPase [Planctomycetota bacterium]
MFESWLQRFREGDRLALSRLLTWISRGQHLDQIRAALAGRTTDAQVIAITGSAGVGKSSLIGKLVEVLRQRGESVAVLACDPASPLTGGALLGDRIRMPSLPDDNGLFIRSLAVPSGQQGVATNIDLMVSLCGSFGFDCVIVETVGAGQGDTAIGEMADIVVVLVQPETGDDLQWEKAGLLEIADVVVVHKSDLPAAARVETHVREALTLSEGKNIEVVRASATKGEGIAELCDVLQQHKKTNQPTTG